MFRFWTIYVGCQCVLCSTIQVKRTSETFPHCSHGVPLERTCKPDWQLFHRVWQRFIPFELSQWIVPARRSYQRLPLIFKVNRKISWNPNESAHLESKQSQYFQIFETPYGCTRKGFYLDALGKHLWQEAPKVNFFHRRGLEKQSSQITWHSKGSSKLHVGVTSSRSISPTGIWTARPSQHQSLVTMLSWALFLCERSQHKDVTCASHCQLTTSRHHCQQWSRSQTWESFQQWYWILGCLPSHNCGHKCCRLQNGQLCSLQT